MNLINEAKYLLKKNIREYGMYIALLVIIVIFAIATKGLFISSRNISNLINQTGYIAVLAVGMTLVIIIRHIDLSVGFLAGFIGAISALMMVKLGMSEWAVIPLVMVIAIFIGLIIGFFVAKVGIPAFVATLAGMLIFRGSLLQVTEGTGTIIIPNAGFNAIGNGFIPDVMHIPGIHVLTLIIGFIGIVLYCISEFKSRNNRSQYGFEVLSMPLFLVKLIFVSTIIGYMTWVLSDYNGLSWTVVIMLTVTGIYHFMTTKTVLGRHIYAVGGNPEAAQLSGINVKKITYFVFASMSLLAALSGILFASRLQSATTTAGTLFELDAIAAAYVGGVSANGGVGKVTGSIIGAFVMASLINGMNLMGVGISLQYIVRGLVLVAAVVFDVITRKQTH